MIQDYFKRIIRTILKVLWVFPVKEKKVFFLNFTDSYCGDIKYVAEYIRANHPGYELFWSVNNPEKYKAIDEGCGVAFLRAKTLKSISVMMTSKYVIYSMNAPAYVPFRNSQILVNTWHGMGYKRAQALGPLQIEQINQTTIFLSPTRFFTDNLIRDSFRYRGEVLECGSPKNDILLSEKKEIVALETKQKIGLPSECQVVLFAPTFRGDFKAANITLDYDSILDAFSSRFGGEWVMLLRQHPNAQFDDDLMDNPRIVDVSMYPDVQELLCTAKALIGDYSSLIWDFSLTRRPIFLYVPDLAEYESSRGLLISFDQLPYELCFTSIDLVNAVASFDNDAYQRSLDEHFMWVGNYESGNACELLLNRLRLTNTDE